MARITVEDCLKHVDNRFELVLMATKRARQLAFGSAEPIVPWEHDKPTVVALREIATGNLTEDVIRATDVQAKAQAAAAEATIAYIEQPIDFSDDFRDLQ